MRQNLTVLHVNVRLERGGSAMVARQLHASLLLEGHASHFLYGYGPKGGRSPAEQRIAHCDRLTSKPRALGNLIAHKILGIDFIRPARARRNTVSSLLKMADVIHLHAIHSHFLPYRWLLAELKKSAKPIVWTIHDSWIVTGRCAIPGNCTRWRTGCGSCPSRSAYPGALVDLTRREAVNKHQLIRELKGQLVLISCSGWMAERLSSVFPDFHVGVITNGVDSEFESAADRVSEPEPTRGRARLLVVGADLSDPVKQDLRILAELAGRDDVTISLVGSHPPPLRGSIVFHGQIGARSRLAQMYSDADALIFTSRVDNFPLTVAETLRVGTPALCLDSPGTREVLSMVQARPFPTYKHLVQAVSDRDWFRGYGVSSRPNLRAVAKIVYSGQRMYRHYLDLYEKLI